MEKNKQETQNLKTSKKDNNNNKDFEGKSDVESDDDEQTENRSKLKQYKKELDTLWQSTMAMMEKSKRMDNEYKEQNQEPIKSYEQKLIYTKRNDKESFVDQKLPKLKSENNKTETAIKITEKGKKKLIKKPVKKQTKN